jgi:sugar phosphate isomerase/epimerase
MTSETVHGLSINLATVRSQWGLPEAARALSRFGIPAIAPWRDQVEETGLGEALRVIRGEGLKVTSLCRGGMFPALDASARSAAIDDNKGAIDEAAELGAACLVVVAGGLPSEEPCGPLSKNLAAARGMVLEGLAAILPHARACGVPLAIEPLHPMYAADRACVNTLEQALDLCDQLGEGVGVAVDVYHVWWDPKLFAQIERASADKRILAHHICDWLNPTRDLLLDRGMMGDGVIDLPSIRRAVESAGFRGPQEVEIFSAENWWKRPGAEVLSVCIERFKLLARDERESQP